MKLALFCIVALAATLAVSAAPQYTTKYDNIDLTEILNNDRLLRNYVNCLLGMGNCTADGKELKDVLPDALETECEKCSQKQKDGSNTVIRFLVNKKPEIWKELSEKYDSDGKYKAKYMEQVKDLGVEA